MLDIVVINGARVARLEFCGIWSNKRVSTTLSVEIVLRVRGNTVREVSCGRVKRANLKRRPESPCYGQWRSPACGAANKPRAFLPVTATTRTYGKLDLHMRLGVLDESQSLQITCPRLKHRKRHPPTRSHNIQNQFKQHVPMISSRASLAHNSSHRSRHSHPPSPSPHCLRYSLGFHLWHS